MSGHLTLLWAQSTQCDQHPDGEAEAVATGQVCVQPGQGVLRLLSACQAGLSHPALLWFSGESGPPQDAGCKWDSMGSVQRWVGLGAPRREGLPTYLASSLQEAVPATEHRRPPWGPCCQQSSGRAWELSLPPSGRSGWRGGWVGFSRGGGPDLASRGIC